MMGLMNHLQEEYFMYYTLSTRLKKALKYIQALNPNTLTPGKYIVDNDFFYIVQEYHTKAPQEGRYEAHKKYVDIQYIVFGQERIDITAAAFLQVDQSYNEETDICFYKEPNLQLMLPYVQIII